MLTMFCTAQTQFPDSYFYLSHTSEQQKYYDSFVGKPAKDYFISYVFDNRPTLVQIFATWSLATRPDDPMLSQLKSYPIVKVCVNTNVSPTLVPAAIILDKDLNAPTVRNISPQFYPTYVVVYHGIIVAVGVHLEGAIKIINSDALQSGKPLK